MIIFVWKYPYFQGYHLLRIQENRNSKNQTWFGSIKNPKSNRINSDMSTTHPSFSLLVPSTFQPSSSPSCSLYASPPLKKRLHIREKHWIGNMETWLPNLVLPITRWEFCSLIWIGVNNPEAKKKLLLILLVVIIVYSTLNIFAA